MEIIKKYEAGMRLSVLAKEYGRNLSTIGTFLKQKEAIKPATPAKGVTVFSSKRSHVHDEMEKLLLVLVKDKEMAGGTITEAIICQKASAIFGDLVLAQAEADAGEGTSKQEPSGFKASRGWFEKFKRRSGVHSVVRHGEAASSDTKAAEAFVKIGDCKGKHLLVYHSNTHRAFKIHTVTKEDLNVLWRANEKAWVTRQLFIDRINICFGPTVKQYLEEKRLPMKCLLVLDNAPVHPPPLDEDVVAEYSFIKTKLKPILKMLTILNLLLGKSMGLGVDEADIDELIEEHQEELTADDLKDFEAMRVNAVQEEYSRRMTH
ncbi:tigger transposable element-derived protein 1-like [Palaemon carinicauda]|uniref:tigger transposable element-derived protein 1-like n=1 Tax=Palaemon carinicauda TaxID=392227 RepID=UPI0035B697C1